MCLHFFVGGGKICVELYDKIDSVKSHMKNRRRRVKKRGVMKMEIRKTQERLGLVKVFGLVLLMALCVVVLTTAVYASTPCSCDVPHSVTANDKFLDHSTLGTGAEWQLFECGELVVGGGYINNTDWDSPWGDYADSITRISFTAPITAGESLMYLFSYLFNVTEIEGLGFLDTSYVTNMAGMFNYVVSVTTLDLSGWDTSNVTNMAGMFNYVLSVTTLDLSGWDTSKVTNMERMFSSNKLTTLDLSGFDTGNVMDMSGMFYGASGLTTLDVSGFDTSKVTNMSWMFRGASGLTTLDVSDFDTSNVTNMSNMFFGASGLTTLDLLGFDTSKVTNMERMFEGASGLTALDVSGWNTSNVTDMDHMFYGASGLTSLDVSGFDTSKVTDMFGMFSGASGLTTLDVSGFDTSNVARMRGMFSATRGLTALDLSGFDTGNVMDMSGMFYGASGLTSLDLSGFDTGNVMSMDMMFLGTSDLKSITFGEKFISRDDNSLPEVSEENGGDWRTVGNDDTLTSAELWDYLRTNDSRNAAEQWIWAKYFCEWCGRYPHTCFPVTGVGDRTPLTVLMIVFLTASIVAWGYFIKRQLRAFAP